MCCPENKKSKDLQYEFWVLGCKWVPLKIVWQKNYIIQLQYIVMHG